MSACAKERLRGEGRVSSSKRWSKATKKYGGSLVGGLLLFAYGFFTNSSHGPISWDQNWFLQVVHRLLTGDVLYRDVWFVATPLSIYITTAFAALFGNEILVIKAVMALCFASTCLLSYRIALQLGQSRFSAVLMVMILLIYYPSWMPGYNVPYTPMGYVFMLASFSAVLSWRKSVRAVRHAAARSATRDLVAAGISAGFCFAGKQNLGLYTLAALCLAVVVVCRDVRASVPHRSRAFALVLAAFSLAAGVILLPVWLSGAGVKLLDYGFFDQGSYMRYAQIGYRTQLGAFVSLTRDAVSLRKLGALYRQLQFILPIPAFAALLWSWVRASSDKRGLATIVLVFVAAAFAGVFPRVDTAHMICAVPALLLGFVWAYPNIDFSVNTFWIPLARMAILLGLGVRLAYEVVGSVRWMAYGIRSGKYQFAPWPGFHGVFLLSDFIEDAETQAEMLKASAASQEVFILSPPAAFYYHVTGLRNPTPFDFPLSTAFGLHGQAEVIEALERGEFCWVCLSPLGSHSFAPVLLETYVQQHMEPVRSTGWCTMYRNPRCCFETSWRGGKQRGASCAGAAESCAGISGWLVLRSRTIGVHFHSAVSKPS